MKDWADKLFPLSGHINVWIGRLNGFGTMWAKGVRQAWVTTSFIFLSKASMSTMMPSNVVSLGFLAAGFLRTVAGFGFSGGLGRGAWEGTFNPATLTAIPWKASSPCNLSCMHRVVAFNYVLGVGDGCRPFFFWYFLFAMCIGLAQWVLVCMFIFCGCWLLFL